MLKLQPHEHEICGISNYTGASWNPEVFGCGMDVVQLRNA